MIIQAGDIIKDGTAVFKVKKFGGGGGLIGRVEWYAGTDTPENYLLCDGSAVSRTDYAELFAVIGTTYGAGDESTTFTLPLLTDGRFIEGSATAGTQHKAGLPNIEGGFNTNGVRNGFINGSGATRAFSISTSDSTQWGGYDDYYGPIGRLTFNASRSSAIYGNSDTVQPLALTMRPLIRYAE